MIDFAQLSRASALARLKCGSRDNFIATRSLTFFKPRRWCRTQVRIGTRLLRKNTLFSRVVISRSPSVHLAVGIPRVAILGYNTFNMPSDSIQLLNVHPFFPTTSSMRLAVEFLDAAPRRAPSAFVALRNRHFSQSIHVLYLFLVECNVKT